MKELYYVIQTLIHGRGANLIKIISLALGLTVSILIFSREAFEFNYDTCYEESECLAAVQIEWNISGEKSIDFRTLGPTAAAIAENFPKEVESATATHFWWGGSSLYKGGVRFSPGVLVADSCFFETIRTKILQGQPAEMKNPDILFISRSLAQEMFAGANPIGETVSYNKGMPMTIKGVYEDYPENSTFYNSRVIVPMATVLKYGWSYWGWNGGSNYYACIRLRHPSDMETINNRIDQMLEKYIPQEDKDNNYTWSLRLIPFSDLRLARNYDGMGIIWILLILAAILLFTVTLNYVLISISSLSRRAKTIGVHKCNGASGWGIMKMFLWETGILIFLSVLLMAFLMLNFKEPLERMADASLSAMFTYENIWAPVCAVLFIFIVGGVLPALQFSRIPVTQVFRRYTEGKKGWKRPLLFIQFTGTAFIFALLALVLVQSNHMTNIDRGFSTERMAFTYYYFSNPENARSTFQNLPYVESVASSSIPLYEGMSGCLVSTESGKQYSMRENSIDKDYLPFIGIKLKEGRNLKQKDEIVVNRKFLELMQWEENPIGRQVRNNDEILGTIVGVTEDFRSSNPIFIPEEPVVFQYSPQFSACIQVKLKEPFDENLKKLNEDVKTIWPEGDLNFVPEARAIELQLSTVSDFRSVAIMATITILFVTLMGLIGYINDEMQRRSKEIGIRKVNGAGAFSILVLLSKDVFWTSMPAVCLGTLGAWYLGDLWTDLFSEMADFPIYYYILIALITLFFIIGCVVIKTWGIANDNPVNSIKNE